MHELWQNLSSKVELPMHQCLAVYVLS